MKSTLMFLAGAGRWYLRVHLPNRRTGRNARPDKSIAGMVVRNAATTR